jgi:hypothetical protein
VNGRIQAVAVPAFSAVEYDDKANIAPNMPEDDVNNYLIEFKIK